MNKASFFLQSLLPHRMKREIKELYVSTLIMNFGVSMVLIFEPIYLYTLGYTLRHIVLFFIVVYVLYFFIVPLGAAVAKRIGYEHSIVISTFIFILYYVVFYNIAVEPRFFYLAAILYAIQKTFYWPAYHADFAGYSDASEEGREIGGIDSIVLITSVIAPFIAGIILSFYGFSVLFICVSLIFLLSNIPLLTTKEVFTPKPFPYLRAYKNLFLKENRKWFLRYLGYGEELIALVVWPIFILIVVKNFLNIGVIASLATLSTILMTLYIGRTSDRRGKKTVLRFGSIMYSLTWFVRMAIWNAWGIFFVETMARFAKESVSLPLVAMTYERAKQRSIMQTVLVFEMSLVVGKLLALFIVYALLLFVPGAIAFQVIFALAGLMTFLYMLS